jgi:CRP-like cAMP-binding protein
VNGPQHFGDEVLANTVHRLLNSRLFQGVPRDLVERCAGLFELRRIGANAILVLDGAPERHVHVIRRGNVRLELRNARGEALVLAQLGAGDVFGVETLVGGRSQATFAVCTQETLLLSARADGIAPAVASCVRMSANVARILAQELDGVATSLHGLDYAELSARVYAALQRVSLERGVAVADGTLLDVALGADDVAALIRSSPDDAAAVLFFLERDGRIRRSGPLITLLATY